MDVQSLSARPDPPAFAPKLIEEQLARMLVSRKFSRSERQARFLRYTVGQALAGAGGSLKEALLGVEVFGRPANYDPRTDPVVRVEATKLRSRLQEYYDEEGQDDPVRIEIPRGGYAPVFHPNLPAETAVAPSRSATPPLDWRWLASAVAIAGSFACGWALGRRQR